MWLVSGGEKASSTAEQIKDQVCRQNSAVSMQFNGSTSHWYDEWKMKVILLKSTVLLYYLDYDVLDN